MDENYILSLLNKLQLDQQKLSEEVADLIEEKEKNELFYEDVKKQVFLYIITTILGGVGLLIFYGLKDAFVK